MNQSVSQTGHPKGLWVLFATEMWERFNYYGMRAILTYFMTQALLFNTEFSNGLYGSYISLLYLTPLVGGYIADRYWGNKRSILVGGLVMALGELILFVCASIYDSSRDMANILFFSGLGFMIAGNGFFKANISSLVGQLYPKGDLRVDPAYTIFYMGINVGATLGPILCGYFGDTGDPSDFKWAFLVAGIGMLISVLIQKLFHDKYVRTPEGKILGLTPGTDISSNDPLIPASSFVKAPSKIWANPVFIIVGLLAFSALMIGVIYLDTRINYLFYLLTASFVFIVYLIQSDKSLNKEEKQRVWVMVIIAFFVMFFWGAYEQTGSTLALFARDQTDRTIFGWEMPASFFQSFNAAFIIIFAPAFAWLWLKMGKSQPATPTKMGIGLILLAFGFLWIAIGAKSGETKTVSMIWLTGLYLLHTWGELCLSPIGLSLFNKLSPLKFASLLMAVWFLGNAGGNKLVGVLGALYPRDGNTTNFLGYQMNNLYDFFMLFVFMGGTAGVILLLLSKKLQKMMHGIV
ncbi:MAG: peptide MFS transporter [Chitinophagaceae bacterium]|jgi:proton-dependent oligopeptide transporter, POT family|nr:peptide MFS transporter [Chitinophagaceae bacterium]